MIPIEFLQICLSLDALDVQIRFHIVFCITLNATNNDNIKTGDRNALKLFIQYSNSILAVTKGFVVNVGTLMTLPKQPMNV